MAFTSRITLLAALAVAAFQAQAVNVTVAYQTSAEPAKVAQADNTFAKTSGATVDWRKFDSGAAWYAPWPPAMCRSVILAPAVGGGRQPAGAD